MSYILSLETATPVCSVALHHQGDLVALHEILVDKSHATHLTRLAEETLSQAKISRADLSAIAVSEGPGSYTGLRIGASTAKGLAFALEIPLIAIPTLEGMAAQVTNLQGPPIQLCPMLDARRMEVYCQLLDANGKVIWDTQALVIETIDPFLPALEIGPVLFFGNGAAKCEEILGPHRNAYFLSDVYPSAKTIGQLASDRFNEEHFVDLAYWEPFYLKEFQPGKPKRR